MLNETEFIAIAGHDINKKMTAINSIRVADCDVAKVNIVRNLGTWFGGSVTNLLSHREIPINGYRQNSFSIFRW